MFWVRSLALASVALALGACSAPQLYSNNVALKYGGVQKEANIQVSDPQFFQRHALINERNREQKFLDGLLDDSINAQFQPGLVRDLETVRALSGALGLSFDAGAKLNSRFAAETNGVAQQIALENLRGQLAQTVRDVELLKAKLAEQSAPSTTPSSAAPAPAPTMGAGDHTDSKAAITQLEAALKAATDRLDKESAATRKANVSSSPREHFQDLQAYRRDLLSASASTSLDALHDIGPNSLFRLQFQALVLPESKVDADGRPREVQLGVLNMEIERPRYSEQEIVERLQPLYFRWLDYVTNELASPDPDSGLQQLALEGRMFSVLAINSGIPRQDDKTENSAKGTTVDHPGASPNMGSSSPEAVRMAQLRSARDPQALHFLSKSFALRDVSPGAFGDAENTGKIGGATPHVEDATAPASPPGGDSKSQKNAAKSKRKSKAAKPPADTETEKSVEAPACVFGISEDQDQKNCIIYRISYPRAMSLASMRKLQGRLADLKPADLNALEDLSRDANSLAPNATLARRNESTVETCRALSSRFHKYQWLIENRTALRRLHRAFSWSYLRMPYEGEPVVFNTLSAQIARPTKLADQIVDSALAAQCSEPEWRTADQSGAAVPPAFIAALFEKVAVPGEQGHFDYVARGRLSTYAVSPGALTQQISTVARAADAIQMAASLAASLPMQGVGANAGLGYMRSVSGKADAIERVPLVIGFSSGGLKNRGTSGLSEAQFGWLLGPKVVIDSEKKALALEHQLSPYTLTADVSMPGWWPEVTIKSWAAWAPDWRNGDLKVMNEHAAGKPNVVPMRHTKADLSSLTSLLLTADQNKNDFIGMGIKLVEPKITEIEPSVVPDCSKAVTFLVKGRNLWRGTTAFLNGVKASSVDVMPDMAGLIVSVDISSVQAGSGSATFVIPTPDGDARMDIQIRGNRGEAASCGKQMPDDGRPRIDAVVPAEIYACDANQFLLVRGEHFPNVSSARLGSINAKPVLEVNGDKAFELKLAGPVGAQGGALDSLPLIVQFHGGAIVDTKVKIIRGECGTRFEQLPFRVVNSAANLELCGKTAPVVLVSGSAVDKIVSATLSGPTPPFSLSSRAIRLAQGTGVGEIEFPILTKGSEFEAQAELQLVGKRGKLAALRVRATCTK